MSAAPYNPAQAEEKWYAWWLENRFFAAKPNPDKKPFVITIPPPNVTGVLHMGHMLNNTIQDVLVRRARMQGREACWVPGTDHASIATEARVVAMLREQGIRKQDIGREEFLKHAFEWKEKYGGIILKQLRKLGASLDWDRVNFTMDPHYTESVIHTFVDLYEKGHIYRGKRMVNWDPVGRTAVSDEEVYHKEVRSKLYYVRYRFVNNPERFLVVATTRPETILADVAIAVNPEDERYQSLLGQLVELPLGNRQIPIIADSYVDKEFGTGCLKVTPAHDINDYEIGLRHGLEVIDMLNEDGTISAVGGVYAGMDRFEARKKFAADLDAAGLLEKAEEITNTVGLSERTHAVIEPRLSEQWFVAMKKLSEPALAAVMNDEVKLHPPKFKNMYRSWMENVRDWCISRQLWWGQRIPAWYLPGGHIVVAHNEAEALQKAQALVPGITLAQMKQDDDVVDTWFSSWLWPIEVFKGISNPGNEEFRYFYPTQDLVTAPEILFFWVARMIIAGYEWTGQKPFDNVYLTGIVRDKQGRKMSKSLGNSPDPEELITKYGADGVRTGMLFSSPAGNDLPFDEKLCEQGRNFWNKLYNASRLVQMWTVADEPQPESNALAVAWMQSRLNQVVAELEEHYAGYRISEALLSTYRLAWDDFCSWYLELIKPGFNQPIDRATLNATLDIFDQLLRLVHPFMPFITEEIWQGLKPRQANESICVAAWPQAGAVDQDLLGEMDLVFSLISQIRASRLERQISPKVPLPLSVETANPQRYARFGALVEKIAGVEQIQVVSELPKGGAAFVVKADKFSLDLAGQIDTDKERENLEKELEYTRGFLQSVLAKLSNERFVANAKADVVERERAKAADAEAKIKALEESLSTLV